MKKALLLFVLLSQMVVAQVGINTTDPKGVLDITSVNNLGLVLPRVSSLEQVTDNNGNNAPNGSVVYDLSREKTCFRINESWVCMGIDPNSGNPTFDTELVYTCSSFDYLKPTVTQFEDRFGFKVDTNATGDIIAIGSPGEDSNAVGVNGDQTNNTATDSGAVYVFVRTGGVWVQEAYIKASNSEAGDFFGYSISLNDVGDKLAVGSYREDSGDATINGNESDNTVQNAGAVYIFNRVGSNWSQEAYLKANFVNQNSSGFGENFGAELDFNGDGTVLAVGATGDDSADTGINADPSIFQSRGSGAVHLFSYNGSNWQYDNYIKAAVIDENDNFGISVKLSSNGERLVVGAHNEMSNSTTINSGETNNTIVNGGAVYVFVKNSGIWSQEAYIKPSAINAQDRFGLDIAINSDASVLAVGAPYEDSNATGINGNASDNSTNAAGAVFVFNRSGTTWSQQAYIKAPFATSGYFGIDLDLNSDGDKLLVGSQLESSDASCFNGDSANTNNISSGAAFLFSFNGLNWSQSTYIKSPNPDAGDWFGEFLAISKNGNTIVIAARREDSSDGTQNNSLTDAGAVYVVD
ncbi:FG-GAP repeat protein [Patiriisocius hiemis]|uniref:Integrin n=1 Tax=Patiriisocius hiemis TaxID=3075604 RepID=A0ABU2YEW4_9FLAO|nr:hypothetical protein [Constantimarinum sp. W242]MDT0556320.1 hypothetical protein [Constantimarinum sp. W242]